MLPTGRFGGDQRAGPSSLRTRNVPRWVLQFSADVLMMFLTFVASGMEAIKTFPV
jgi:hypothetical protein